MNIIPGAVVEGERARQQQRHQQNLWEQLRWHTAQARRHRTVMGVLVGHHEQEAQRIERILGIDHEGDSAA